MVLEPNVILGFGNAPFFELFFNDKLETMIMNMKYYYCFSK